MICFNHHLMMKKERNNKKKDLKQIILNPICLFLIDR
jgi:hypothetical protein